MAQPYDAIVIGSGFGGAVAACRLAQAGHRVLVLERGRRWQVEEYPRKPSDAWCYDPTTPETKNGWLDLRIFGDMIVAQGAGVGGGSLIYANISVDAPPEIFAHGWPPELTYQELAPYYQRVAEVMAVREVPANQLTRRFQLVRQAAENIGASQRFRALPLAVSFSERWHYDLPEPFDPRHSERFTNAQGQEQGTCIHLGECDLGCPVKAKNTLDLNYLALAEQHGADIRPLHLVQRIAPEGSGYRVFFDRLADGQRRPGSETAPKVVLAAGSLGSTELLLRCRDQHRTLPRLSPFLGHGWSSNGDFLTPAFHADQAINPTQGPTISAAIDFLDGSEGGARFYIEDGGFPDLLRGYLSETLAQGSRHRRWNALLRHLKQHLDRQPPLSNVMPWFAQGIDAADGRLYLGRQWWMPWRRVLKLDWDVAASEAVINGIVAMHERLATATGGTAWVPPTWSLFKILITPHPLGGCNMGPDASRGVVDHLGQVFGYERLYVADGAIIPEAIGRNPSRTIAALAERSMTLAATR